MAATASELSIPAIKHMQPSLFRAIMEDKVEEVKGLRDQLEHQTTPNENTALHVAAQYGKANCADEILSLCPSLLVRRNDQEETALHFAAKRGDLRIVEALLKSAKEGHKNRDIEMEGRPVSEWLIRKTSKKNDTALHEAVKYNRHRVVECLVNEDPDFIYSTNKHGEAPLYLAARKGFSHVAVIILDKCRSLVYDGPVGRTALHAAVASDLEDLCERLRNKIPDLARIADEKKRTPLHFAAWFDRPLLVEKLTKWDQTLAYMRDEEGRTPLHIAAKEGHISCITKLLEQCPDCYEMVDYKGHNALHIAAEKGKKFPVKLILKNPQISSLINQGDDKGNTPLHLLAVSRKYIRTFLRHPELDKKVVNYDHLTALDILPPTSFSSSDAVDSFHYALDDVTPTKCAVDNSNADNDNEDVTSIIERISETHVVVATLIATVAFAAGFTLPGGYNDDEGPDIGTATLIKKSAFQAFVISDTLALLLSICAVFTHFLRVLKMDVKFNEHISLLAAFLTITAMAAMVIAYVTGTFVVLSPSLGLAIVNSVIGCFFFLYVYQLIKSAFGR